MMDDDKEFLMNDKDFDDFVLRWRQAQDRPYRVEPLSEYTAPEYTEDWEEEIPLEYPPERVIRGGWWIAAAMWLLILSLLCGTIILISYTVRGG